MNTRQVKVNELFTVSLKTNPSTGYIWKHEPLQGIVLLDIKYDIKDPSMVGGETTAYFYFKTETPGEYFLKINKVRPWEKHSKPLETYKEKIFAS